MTRITALPLLLALGSSWATALFAAPPQCSYESYQWSTSEQRAVNRRQVTHPYSALRAEEIDPDTGCSVCREDQVEVAIPRVEPFLVCRIVAPAVEAALRELIDSGEVIEQVVGYRVGKTRGDVDAQGLRTGFSNHSYGVAIDINPQHNGLYDRCIDFGPHCRLLRGGEWQPHTHAASLAPQGAVVRRLKQEGFRWGGEIRGRQKDFMHFSPSGY
jgi:hypothetical protein